MKLILAILLVTFAVACGQKKDDIFTKPMYFPAGIYIGTDPALHLTWSTGSGMVWPSAGIPVSTGTAWSGSIVNNSAHWDLGYQAYLWGNHSGLYRPITWKPDYNTEILNIPEEIELSVAITQYLGDIQILTQTQINSLIIPVGRSKIVFNSTDQVWQGWNGAKWIVFATTNN